MTPQQQAMAFLDRVARLSKKYGVMLVGEPGSPGLTLISTSTDTWDEHDVLVTGVVFDPQGRTLNYTPISEPSTKTMIVTPTPDQATEQEALPKGPMDFLFEESPGSPPESRPRATRPGPPVKSITVGLRVRTKTMPNPPDDWTQEVKASRQFGITGTVVSAHNSHGLCFGVEHDDNGFVSYYDPQELEALDP